MNLGICSYHSDENDTKINRNSILDESLKASTESLSVRRKGRRRQIHPPTSDKPDHEESQQLHPWIHIERSFVTLIRLPQALHRSSLENQNVPIFNDVRWIICRPRKSTVAVPNDTYSVSFSTYPISIELDDSIQLSITGIDSHHHVDDQKLLQVLCGTNSDVNVNVNVNVNVMYYPILEESMANQGDTVSPTHTVRIQWKHNAASNGDADATSNITKEVNTFSIRGESECTLKNNGFQSLGAMYTISKLAIDGQLPTPLLSLTLNIMQQNDCSLSAMPLLRSFWKRHLVGAIIVWKNASHSQHNITTILRLPIPSSYQCHNTRTEATTIVQMQVDAAIPIPSDHRHIRARQHSFYQILPSTRITLLGFTDPKTYVRSDLILHQANKHLVCNDDKHNMWTSAPAAHCMFNTIVQIAGKALASSMLPQSFLLTGPPGVGKTHAVRMACLHTQPFCKLYPIQGGELMAAGNGASAAQALVRYFNQARSYAKSIKQSHSRQGDLVNNMKENDFGFVSVIFLDEVDALVSSAVVVASLATLLDRVAQDSAWSKVIVVAATNRIDCIPENLRRPGRFDKEIPLSPPTAIDRALLLHTMLVSKPTVGDMELMVSRTEIEDFAMDLVGYVPADLAALVRRTVLIAIQSRNRTITIDQLQEAAEQIGASALRDALLSAPPTTNWSDIVGDPGGAKTELRQAVEWPRTKRNAFDALGLQPPRGILLHGPPGCAKTLMARAAAGAIGVSFLSLSPADVFASSYVGEAEAVVRRAFSLARSASPCILFFDEIDAIAGSLSTAPSREGTLNRASYSSEARVLSTFLNEMDGVDTNNETQSGVLVLGATNRPWTLDAALLRPGRFDKVIFVPPPDVDGRKMLFRQHLHHKSAIPEIMSNKDEVYDLLASAEVSGSMTGAEIVGACREASLRYLHDILQGKIETNATDKFGNLSKIFEYVEEVLRKVPKALSNPKALDDYELFIRRYE
jgi:SpoVK/Ycf46/Vps4 family AAA+-type ATPase